MLELAVLMQEFGYACAAAPLLGTTVAGLVLGAAGDETRRAELLPGLASGETPAALALVGRRELVPDAAPDRLLVVGSRESGRCSVVRRDGVEAAAAIDPRRAHGLALGTASGEELPADIRLALDAAAVVVAAELVGLCRRALETTVAYVKERRQFGVPVGSFQAVQHVAAQMLRDTEAASVCTMQAAWLADNDPAALPVAAAMAKASASAAGRSVTGAAIQLHGGIGFTWEAEPHWLFKRAHVDAAYLGGSGEHYARIARSSTGSDGQGSAVQGSADPV